MLNNAAVQQRLRRQFAPLVAVVLDEISMIGAKLWHVVVESLRAIHSDDDDDPFGGTLLLICGDFFQLPPVLDQPLTSIAAGNMPADVALTRLKFHSNIEDSIVLSKSMRAVADKEFADLQMRMRSGTCNAGDVASLNARCVERMFDPRVVDAIDAGAKCIVSDNGLRDALNAAMAQRWATRRGRELRLYAAHDVRTRKRIDDDGNRATRADTDAANATTATTTTAAMTSDQRSRARAPLTAAERAAVARVDTQHAAKLPHVFACALGMPVLLTDNAAGGAGGVQIGVANGVSGVVVGVIDDSDALCERGTADHRHCLFIDRPPAAVFVRLDAAYDAEAKKYRSIVAELPDGVVVIRPRKSAKPFKVKCGDKKHFYVRRRQVSLDAYHAITAHKAQGRTMNDVVHIVATDANNNIKQNTVYVPWSRVRRLSQLTIVFHRPLTARDAACRPAPHVTAFMEKAMRRHATTMATHAALVLVAQQRRQNNNNNDDDDDQRQQQPTTTTMTT
jgi:hypothetical protein